MGTAPSNFPPNASLIIGEIQTGNKLGLTAALTTTVFFTAPNSGMYLLSAVLQVTNTDGAGTLAMTMTTPETGPITVSSTAKVVQNPNLATPVDGFIAPVPVWLNQGQTASMAVAAGSLGLTTYNVFLSAQRVF